MNFTSAKGHAILTIIFIAQVFGNIICHLLIQLSIMLLFLRDSYTFQQISLSHKLGLNEAVEAC